MVLRYRSGGQTTALLYIRSVWISLAKLDASPCTGPHSQGAPVNRALSPRHFFSLYLMSGGQLRVVRGNTQVSFGELADSDLLDTAELCYLFGCSARTLYRWINERGLRPRGQVGRELFFAKGDVVKWFYSSNRPSGPGRPKL